MIKVLQLSRNNGALAFALALMAVAMLTLAGVGGYEVGTSIARSHPATTPVSSSPGDGGRVAAPDFGPQP